jgi:endonuclease/exonuclease/phosphatase family metal-dependent hydrolase
MRIGSYNVENLFARAKVFDDGQSAEAKAVLAAFAEFSELRGHPVYSDADKARMLELLDILGLLKSDDSKYVWFRKVRGVFLRRPKSGPPTIVASGSDAWIGWLELKTAPVRAVAMANTARVINELGAEILGVVEAESRPTLARFATSLIAEVGGTPPAHVMLIDGNDDRGIDVGILTTDSHDVIAIRSHVDDVDDEGLIFSRDCAEYHVRANDQGDVIVVMVNHFKSKGYSTPGDKLGAKRRGRQAKRVAEIYKQRIQDGFTNIAVVGDFNDSPDSAALDALLVGTDLRDISTHPNFDFGTRKGTFGSGNEGDKIDYVLLSPNLFAKATGGAVFRKGVWRGPHTKNPWPMFDTLTSELEAASDHAAIYADIDI